MKRLSLSPRAIALLSVFTLIQMPAALQAQAPPDSAVLAGLRFRTIGPAVVGGRVSDIAVVESDPRIWYVGTATGGVWKTESHGASFTPVFDHQETSSIGDVAIAPSNPNIIWVGTGEPQNRQSSPYGAGVWKSVDAGRTWEKMGLAETRHVGRIVIDPRNPDVVYMAAVGHLWGPNPERGVFRTEDGGGTWEKVLYVDENTGAIDLAMDPSDPATLFAAMYQRRRTAWGFNGGGPGSGLYRTTDGGDHWTELTKGLPEGDMGRIGISIYRRDPNLVFAAVQAVGDAQGVYASTDRGATWEKRSGTNQRPMYFSQIRVDPNDPERVYMPAVSLWVSSDGGRTFRDDGAEDVHPDTHAFWIDPNDSDHILLGGDGGVSATFDRAEHWRMYDNLPLAQFYAIGVDMKQPYTVCGGLQDNGSWCGPSNSLSSQGIRNADWRNIGGGDGFYARLDPNDPTIVYTESQGGNLSRLNLVTGEEARIRPVERLREPKGMEGDPDSVNYRWNWNTPLIVSSADPATLYFGANVLFRSTDRGMSWRQISPDLTHHIDRDTLRIMGRLPNDSTLSLNDGVSAYGTLTTISESPLDADVIYTGADDGAVFMTRDGGATWTDLSGRFPDLPAYTYVSRVLASGGAPGTVYATFDGHYADDYKSYVYVSRDFGETWTSITDGLPDESVNVIAQHPHVPDLLFAGNEVGVWFSTDAGQHWSRLRGDLPTVPVDDILVHPRDDDLILATHGRGIWTMDEITPLEQLSPQVLASDAHLFPVRPATEWNRADAQAWVPAEYFVPNPEPGALIRYYLRQAVAPPVIDDGAAAGDSADAAARDSAAADTASASADSARVTLTILDASGDVVRKLHGPGTPGIHEVVWDFRPEPAFEVPENAGGGFNSAARLAQGPRVLPGTYRVRLEAGATSPVTDVVVRLDPRVEIEPAQLAARQQAMQSAFRLAKPLYEADVALDTLRQQVAAARKLLNDRKDVPSALRDEAKSLAADLDTLADDLGDVTNDASAGRTIDGWTAPPPEDALWQIDHAWQELPGVLERVNDLITTRVPAFFGRIYQPAAAPRVPARIEMPARN